MVMVLQSGWWGEGPKVAELEKEFAKKVGAKYAVATNSCTSALDLVLWAWKEMGHKLKGKELITTPMTFVSDAIVGEWHDMDVTFADIEEDSLCIDPETIKVGPKTGVVIAVHSHGRLANIPAIRAKLLDGLIIEDCAHAMFTPGAGRWGDVAVWSFQAVKTLPAGDGGMITTDNEEMYQLLRSLKWLGVEKSTYQRAGAKKYAWDYDIVRSGIKAYMNDLTAVLVLGNLARIDQMNARRREIQGMYDKAFSEVSEITVPKYSDTVQYYTMQCMRRDELSEYLAGKGIATSVHFKPLSEMTYWRKAVKQELPVTDVVWKTLLSLPCHDALTNRQIRYIINCVKEFYS